MDEEFKSLASNRRDAEISATVTDREAVKFYAWILRGLLVAAVAVALFYARTEYKFAKIDEWIAAEEKIDANWKAGHEKFDAYITSNNITNLATANALDSIRERLSLIDAWKLDMGAKISEMWFMKEKGITNDEDFFQRHGYTAPKSNGPKDP